MRRPIIMLVLVIASFMDLMDAMITNVALPSIQKDLNASSAQLEWTASAYVLLFAVLLITGGRLGDMVGRRSVFLVGIAGFSFASLAITLAQNGEILVVMRGVQGAFAALMVPQVLSTAQALYAPDERGKILGVMSALGGLGVLAGQLLGGWMVTANAFGIGWRSVFAINIPTGLVIFVLTLILVPNTAADERIRLDLVGTLLAVVSALGIVFPLIEGNSQDWPRWIWAVLIVGLAALTGFIAHERARGRKGKDVLLPMSLFADHGFAVGSLVQVSNYLGWGSFAIMIMIYTQEALHFSPLQAGLVMLPVTLGSFLGTVLSPVAAKLGRGAVIAGGLIQATGFTGYALAIHHAGKDLTIWSLSLPLLITGVGMIVFAVPLMSLALHNVPHSNAGAASGILTMFQQLGNAFGIAIVGSVFFGILGNGADQSAYQHAIISGNWVTVTAFGTASVLAALMPGRTSSTSEPARPSPTGTSSL